MTLFSELQISVTTMTGNFYKSYRIWEQTSPYKAVRYRKTEIGIRKIQVQNPLHSRDNSSTKGYYTISFIAIVGT